MVRKLYSYVGKNKKPYFDLGEGCFRSIVYYKIIGGSKVFFIDVPGEQSVRIKANGKERVVLEDGVFILAKDRKPKTLSRRLVN